MACQDLSRSQDCPSPGARSSLGISASGCGRPISLHIRLRRRRLAVTYSSPSNDPITRGFSRTRAAVTREIVVSTRQTPIGFFSTHAGFRTCRYGREFPGLSHAGSISASAQSRREPM
jgi:hypothetical protein